LGDHLTLFQGANAGGAGTEWEKREKWGKSTKKPVGTLGDSWGENM